MIKLSNKKLVEDVNTLKIIAQKKLPFKANFAIAKNLIKIETILSIYNKEKQKMINEYCEKDEAGNLKIENDSYKIKEGLIEAFNKENEELLGIENEIDVHMFKYEELASARETTVSREYDILTAAEIMTIEYMIEE